MSASSTTDARPAERRLGREVLGPGAPGGRLNLAHQGRRQRSPQRIGKGSCHARLARVRCHALSASAALAAASFMAACALPRFRRVWRASTTLPRALDLFGAKQGASPRQSTEPERAEQTSSWSQFVLLRRKNIATIATKNTMISPPAKNLSVRPCFWAFLEIPHGSTPRAVCTCHCPACSPLCRVFLSPLGELLEGRRGSGPALARASGRVGAGTSMPAHGRMYPNLWPYVPRPRAVRVW